MEINLKENLEKLKSSWKWSDLESNIIDISYHHGVRDVAEFLLNKPSSDDVKNLLIQLNTFWTDLTKRIDNEVKSSKLKVVKEEGDKNEEVTQDNNSGR